MSFGEFSDYHDLAFERRPDGVLLVRIDRPRRANAIDSRLHDELVRVWPEVEAAPDIRAVVVTGAGRTFSAGGDVAALTRNAGTFEGVAEMLGGAWRLVRNMIECEKPIISAINGPAVGAGLAVALLADISIIGENTRISDGHLRMGVAAGDHAAVIWPLLCGMAKAKYYLLTAEFLDGREAERIGLVSCCLPEGESVLDRALEVATGLARGPRHATRWTKRTLNHWLRGALPAFDASMGAEMLCFFGDDVLEAARALREGRPAAFPSAQPVG